MWRNIFRELAFGESISYGKVAAALQMRPDNPAFRRRCDTARRQLERPEEGGIVVTCIPGEGFVREHPESTKARVEVRETKSIARKAARNIRQLNTIDVSKLDGRQKSELFGLMTQQAAVKITASKPARQKLVAAATISEAQLTVVKALEVLQNKSEST